MMVRRFMIVLVGMVLFASMQVGCSDACQETSVTVTGVVQMADGTAIPNAVVQITNPDAKNSDPIQFVAITDAEGRFAFDAITMNGCDPFELFVNADRYEPKVETYNATGEGELTRLPDNLVITLDPR
jgi:hypothetical protein